MDEKKKKRHTENKNRNIKLRTVCAKSVRCFYDRKREEKTCFFNCILLFPSCLFFFFLFLLFDNVRITRAILMVFPKLKN